MWALAQGGSLISNVNSVSLVTDEIFDKHMIRGYIDGSDSQGSVYGQYNTRARALEVIENFMEHVKGRRSLFVFPEE